MEWFFSLHRWCSFSMCSTSLHSQCSRNASICTYKSMMHQNSLSDFVIPLRMIIISKLIAYLRPWINKIRAHACTLTSPLGFGVWVCVCVCLLPQSFVILLCARCIKFFEQFVLLTFFMVHILFPIVPHSFHRFIWQCPEFIRRCSTFRNIIIHEDVFRKR